VRLGAGSARLARRLEAEGEPDEPADLPRSPSGRLRPDAAEELFALRRAEVEAAPQDWRAWWRLAAAYGEARDTSAGRRALRRAIALERADRDG
jgi:cytochrome c-type biogenesis protein CcmH/NrfG